MKFEKVPVGERFLWGKMPFVKINDTYEKDTANCFCLVNKQYGVMNKQVEVKLVTDNEK